MRPIVPAAVAACLAFIPAPASAATLLQYAGRNIYSVPDLPAGYVKLYAILKQDVAAGETRHVTLADFESLRLTITFFRPWPFFEQQEIAFDFGPADIPFLEADVIGQPGQLVFLKSANQLPAPVMLATSLKAPAPNAWGTTAPMSVTIADQFVRISNGQGTRIAGVHLTDVPEPAAWAMMLAGFGLAGASMRNRSRSRSQSAWAAR